jgi:hypothetical protein
MIRRCVYVRYTPTGTLHLAEDDNAKRTLCGVEILSAWRYPMQIVNPAWVWEEETSSGISTSCGRCKRVYKSLK